MKNMKDETWYVQIPFATKEAAEWAKEKIGNDVKLLGIVVKGKSK